MTWVSEQLNAERQPIRAERINAPAHWTTDKIATTAAERLCPEPSEGQRILLRMRVDPGGAWRAVEAERRRGWWWVIPVVMEMD